VNVTVLTDFSPEDLAILNRTPTSVAMAAAYANQDGALTLAKEMEAGLRAASDAAAAFPENEIIQFLAAAMHEVNAESSSENPEENDSAGDEDVVDERSPLRAGEASLELVAEAIEVMKSTATIEEFVQFKHWLYAVADQVTLAAKSGGFFGFGGTQVGEGEMAYLEQLRDVLEMPAEEAQG